MLPTKGDQNLKLALSHFPSKEADLWLHTGATHNMPMKNTLRPSIALCNINLIEGTL